jgi:hypothetical protein
MTSVRAELLEIAWRDFILWCASQPDAVAAFNKQTGRTFLVGNLSPLEVAIDHATGKLGDDTSAFVNWVTETQWGTDEAPERWRRERGLT